MNTLAVMVELRERGARVEIVNGRLRITPKKAVPVEQRDWITEHKAELLALLASEADVDRVARVASLTLTLERDHGFTREKAERLASLPVEQMTDDEVGYWAGKVRFAWPAPEPARAPVTLPAPGSIWGLRGRPTCASQCCWEPRAWRALDRGDGQPGAWTCVVCHPPALLEFQLERREGASDG